MLQQQPIVNGLNMVWCMFSLASQIIIGNSTTHIYIYIDIFTCHITRNPYRQRHSWAVRFCDYDTLLMHKWFGNENEFETIAVEHASVAFTNRAFNCNYVSECAVCAMWNKYTRIDRNYVQCLWLQLKQNALPQQMLIEIFRFMALIIDFLKFDISYPQKR